MLNYQRTFIDTNITKNLKYPNIYVNIYVCGENWIRTNTPYWESPNREQRRSCLPFHHLTIIFIVDRLRIELNTPKFSVLCSTK